MNPTVLILFYIKRTKVNREGLAPIYARVTIDSKRFEFSTNKFVSPDKWSTQTSKIRSNNQEARLINKHLDLLKFQILDAENKLLFKNIPITSENLKEELFGKSLSKRMLIPIFQDHNNRIKALVNTEYSPGTLERYNTSFKHTQDFLLWKFKKSHIDIVLIDHVFVADYEFYLRKVRDCSNNSAVKYIRIFHKIINICLNNEWMNKNPFIGYKSKIEKINVRFFTNQQLKEIQSKNFISERLCIVRDIFFSDFLKV